MNRGTGGRSVIERMACGIAVLLVCWPNPGVSAEPESNQEPDSDLIALHHEQTKSDCGPLALAYCLAKTGRPVSLDRILEQFPGRTEDGVKVGDLLDQTQSHFPEACVAHIDAASIEDMPKPAIVIFRSENHCVVAERFDGATNRLSVWDPAILDSREIPIEELSVNWQGDLILLEEPTNTLRESAYLSLLGICGMGLTLGVSYLFVSRAGWNTGASQGTQCRHTK